MPFGAFILIVEMKIRIGKYVIAFKKIDNSGTEFKSKITALVKEENIKRSCDRQIKNVSAYGSFETATSHGNFTETLTQNL